MPNIWTHFIFGRELAKRIGWNDAFSTPELQRVFQLGCQGPDFLFYHRFFPWQSSIGMQRLGGTMHKEACGPLLLDLLENVKGQPLQSADTVYTLGFLTHHILDRNAHPYIFYRSGFKKWHHQRFEIIIDTLVARKLLNVETWNTPVWEQLYVGDQLPGKMADVFVQLTRKHYPDAAGTLTPDDWNDAYRGMIRAQKLFHDPSGWKRLLTFGQIEPFVFKKTNAPIDYLNEAKQPWRHPSDLDEESSSSFWDLWDQAMDDGAIVMDAAIAYISAYNETDYTGSTRLPLELCLGNISYETGKPCDSGLTIVHADPII
ncbi:MAG: hypothetical protein K0Q59_1008 [Paenibacillus sp.]|jgi:hypothetical protein|nr:hypothetical protein [Paenibacillus sp.]